MKRNNIIIGSRKGPLWFAAAVLAMAPAGFAHSGFQHVLGTVVKVSGNMLTVKTAKGNVDVKLSEKTRLTRGDRNAQTADLKPGTRVVAEVPEDSPDHVAQSVKIGASPQSAGAPHSQASRK